MEDKAEVARSIGSNERGAIHDARNVLQSLGQFDVVNGRVDVRECAQDLLRLKARLKWRVSLWIEGLGMGHAAGHPENNHRVCYGNNFLFFCRQELPRKTSRERRKGGSAGGFEKITACHGKWGAGRVHVCSDGEDSP